MHLNLDARINANEICLHWISYFWSQQCLLISWINLLQLSFHITILSQMLNVCLDNLQGLSHAVSFANVAREINIFNLYIYGVSGGFCVCPTLDATAVLYSINYTPCITCLRNMYVCANFCFSTHLQLLAHVHLRCFVYLQGLKFTALMLEFSLCQ